MSGTRHHRLVRDQQVGALFRVVRVRSRERQEDVAAGAGVARWRVSALERGHLDAISIGQLRSIASELEIRVEIGASWRGGDGVRLVNERHSRMHEMVGARLAATPGWEFATEVSFSEWGERGSVDILAWHAASRTLLVIELKTELPDPAGLVAQVDRYRRLAPKFGRDRGWDPLNVASWVLVAESDLNRDQLARHRLMLRNAFPLDGRFLRRWLADPSRSSQPDTARPSGGGAAGGAAGGGAAGGGGAGGGAVNGLSFLANVTVGSTSGRLGPTKRVRRPRRQSVKLNSLVSDQQAAHK